MKRQTSLVQKLDDLFFKGVLVKKFGFEAAREIVIFTLASLVTSALLVFFGIQTLRIGSPPVAVVDFILSGAILLNYLLARKRGAYTIHLSLLVALVATVFIFAFVTGGAGGHGFLWYLCYPLIATFLSGSDRGLIYSLAMLVPAGVIFIGNYSLVPDFYHQPGFALTFTAAYLVITGMTVILERTREFQVTQLRSAQAGLERKVEERTRDLAEARSGLEKTVTERTAELVAANEQLQDLDRLKSMFLASMSHELRTPLNAIIGFTGVMLKGMAGEVNAEQKKQLSFVKENADSLLALIEDVIDVSRIETGKIEITIEEFDLREALDETVRSLSADLQRKGVGIHIACPEGLQVRSNRRRVRQIALNLLSNALKATAEGRIEVDAVKKSGKVSVVVTDRGIGIAAEDLDRIFQPFSQVTSTDRPKDGAGLGLYLSRKTAELLGGSITVSSEPGRGSSFTLTLPA